MNTLTTSYHHPATDRPTPGLLARIVALVTTKAAPAQPSDPVERFIQDNGGVLTDQLEREISRRFGSIVGR